MYFISFFHWFWGSLHLSLHPFNLKRQLHLHQIAVDIVVKMHFMFLYLHLAFGFHFCLCMFTLMCPFRYYFQNFCEDETEVQFESFWTWNESPAPVTGERGKHTETWNQITLMTAALRDLFISASVCSGKTRDFCRDAAMVSSTQKGSGVEGSCTRWVCSNKHLNTG